MTIGARVLVVNDTRHDQHHGCVAVMSTIASKLEGNHVSRVEYWPAHLDWRGSVEFEQMLVCSQLVIVNGEGTIHHNSEFGRRLLEVGAAAKANNIPVALINSGWESNSRDFAEMLGDFDLVSARDSTSASEMGSEDVLVRVVPDLSLCVSYVRERRRQSVGVTDSVDRLRALELDRIKNTLHGRTVSIQFGDSYSKFIRNGVAIREDAMHPARLISLLRMRHGLWKASRSSLATFLEELGRLELLISGRFHACTLALVANTPFVSSPSNTSKIDSMIQDAGLEAWRARLPEDSSRWDDLGSFEWTKNEAYARHAYLARARDGADALFRDLRAMIE